MATSSDVPHVFDLVIGSSGFVLADNWTGGDSSNVAQKAIHAFAPAFVQRANTQGYGDDQQEFWLSVSQNDWSLGEQQRHAQQEGTERIRRYWTGSSVDVTTPGQVSLRPATDVLSFTEAPEAMIYDPINGGVAYGGATKLFTIAASGTETDKGVHGLGTAPVRWGMCSDGSNLYLTSEETSTVGVRKWTGSAFSTFSATGSSALAYLNNTLYGLDKSGILRRYSSAGAASTVFTWNDAAGTALSFGLTGRLLPYGGKLLILLPDGPEVPELWIYDGAGVSLLHKFPSNFVPHDIVTLSGTVFISGYLKSSGTYRPTIYYYANGQIGVLWQADDYGTGLGGPALAAFGETLIFTDSQNGKVLSWNPVTGGVSSIGTYSASDTLDQLLAVAGDFFVVTNAGGSGFQTPALVQSNGVRHQSPSSSPKSVSWPAPTTAGNTLLLAVAISGDTGTPSVTTPSGWTLVGSEVSGTSKIYLYKIVGASSRSGAQSVAWTGGNSDVFLQLFEYSGTGIEDVASVGDIGTGTAIATGTTTTTTQDDELWFAIVNVRNALNGVIGSINNDFALVRQDGSTSSWFAAYDVAVSATGDASFEGTLDVDPSLWLALVSTFKAKAIGEGYLFPGDEKAAGGQITHSLFDFDSSLSKLLRGIKIDFDEATDGDGGTVEISYRTEDVDGDYTTLTDDATSGTEYTISSATGHAISVRVTLNRGTSTDGPVFKRLYVRAAPLGNNFKRSRYVLAAWGRGGDGNVQLRNGSYDPRTGLQIAQDLIEFAESQTPLTITDKFETFTGIVESCELTEYEDREFIAHVTVREI